MRRSMCLLALLALGCGSTLSEAVAELEAGRPADADLRFRALETDLARFDEQDRARYALYRGLTHLTLGDARNADLWLTFAKRGTDRRLELLSPAERGRLLAAWRTLGRMPGEE
jgi:hypothetical protein